MNYTSIAPATAVAFALVFSPIVGSVPSYDPVATVIGPTAFDHKDVEAFGYATYIHDTTGCTATIGCIYDIWTIQVSGTFITGWGVIVCTNRDDSFFCTTIDADYDDSSYGYKGTEITGAPKEDKDPDWAHTDFCVRPDLDGTYDDFWAAITFWVDEDQVFVDDGDDENTGNGLSIGTFDIYVEGGAAVADVASCMAAIDHPGAEG